MKCRFWGPWRKVISGFATNAPQPFNRLRAFDSNEANALHTSLIEHVLIQKPLRTFREHAPYVID
jgi:hypothetical protein